MIVILHGLLPECMWDVIDDIRFSGTKPDFLRAFFGYIRGRRLSEHEPNRRIIFETAGRLGVSNEEMRDTYLESKLSGIRPGNFDYDINPMPRFKNLLDDLELFGPVPEDVLRQFLPEFERIAGAHLEHGAPLTGLDNLLQTFRPFMDEDFRLRADRYEVKSAEIVLDNYIRFGHDDGVVDRLQILKQKQMLDRGLEETVRLATIDNLASNRGRSFAAVLKEVGWERQIDEVYEAVVVGLMNRIWWQAETLFELDRQNKLPPHMAAIMAYQLEDMHSGSFDNSQKPALGLALERRGELSPDLTEKARISMETAVLTERRLARLSADTATKLFEIYEKLGGNPASAGMGAKAGVCIQGAIDLGEYSHAYDLAKKVAGAPDKINLARFNAAANKLEYERVKIIRSFLARDIQATDAIMHLERVVSGLYTLETLVGSNLQHNIEKELLAIVRGISNRSSGVELQYLCTLLDNYQLLKGESAANVARASGNIDIIQAAFRREYSRLQSATGRLSSGLVRRLSRIYESGYLILFGQPIQTVAVSPREREPARYNHKVGQSSMAAAAPTREGIYIAVYFGGKAFEQSREALNELIPIYKGRTGSEDIEIGGRSRRLFKISMSANEYQSIVQNTILGSSVQAIEVPLNYGIEQRVLDGPRLRVTDSNGKRFLHNGGQLQTLAPHQVEAIKRILVGS